MPIGSILGGGACAAATLPAGAWHSAKLLKYAGLVYVGLAAMALGSAIAFGS